MLINYIFKCLLIFLLLFFKQFQLLGEEEKLHSSLEDFWRLLIKNYDFGYTLFGDKTLTFDRYQLTYTFDTPSHCKENFLLKNLWNEWNKALILQDQKNFVLRKVVFINEKKESFEEFFLVNKSCCLKVIEDHWQEFKKEFKDSNSPSTLLEKICQNGPHLIKSHKLIGLILGFGEHNSKLFQQREDLFNELALYLPYQTTENINKLTSYDLLNLRAIRKQALFTKDQKSWLQKLKQYHHLDQILCSHESLIPYKELLSFRLPCYVVDKFHPETYVYLQKYLKTEEKITQIYYNPSFLEIVLNKFQE